MTNNEQLLWDVCDELVDNLDAVQTCRALIMCADRLAESGAIYWVASADYEKAKEIVAEYDRISNGLPRPPHAICHVL